MQWIHVAIKATESENLVDKLFRYNLWAFDSSLCNCTHCKCTIFFIFYKNDILLLYHRNFCLHIYLQSGGYSHWEVQCHLQPAEVTGMADPIPCLQSHCFHLGSVLPYYDTLSHLQHPGEVHQIQQHHSSHVPPWLAKERGGASVVSAHV